MVYNQFVFNLLSVAHDLSRVALNPSRDTKRPSGKAESLSGSMRNLVGIASILGNKADCLLMLLSRRLIREKPY